MITNVELDLKAINTADLHTLSYGHAVMVEYHLNNLPKTDEGNVDISKLTESASSDLISPISRFQRLVNTQVRLEAIRTELANREINK